MKLSDLIEQFINSILEQNGSIEIQRNDLAEQFKCVPSQINYVISTRFSPEFGYIVESRRGGGGYVRIKKISFDKPTLLMHTIAAIGESLDKNSADALCKNLYSAQILTERELKIILGAVSETALRKIEPSKRSETRAKILKSIFMAIASK